MVRLETISSMIIYLNHFNCGGGGGRGGHVTLLDQLFEETYALICDS